MKSALIITEIASTCRASMTGSVVYRGGMSACVAAWRIGGFIAWEAAPHVVCVDLVERLYLYVLRIDRPAWLTKVLREENER